MMGLKRLEEEDESEPDKQPVEELAMRDLKSAPEDEQGTTRKSTRQPPEAWTQFDSGMVGRGNPVRNARSLAYARAIVAKIDASPALAEKGLANLARLRAQRGGALNGCDEEWERILQQRKWCEVRTLLLDETDEGQRLRAANPFTGILSQEERNAVHEAYRP